eukprot:5757941-Prymnesium_polylepis.1
MDSTRGALPPAPVPPKVLRGRSPHHVAQSIRVRLHQRGGARGRRCDIVRGVRGASRCQPRRVQAQREALRRVPVGLEQQHRKPDRRAGGRVQRGGAVAEEGGPMEDSHLVGRLCAGGSAQRRRVRGHSMGSQPCAVGATCASAVESRAGPPAHLDPRRARGPLVAEQPHDAARRQPGTQRACGTSSARA